MKKFKSKKVVSMLLVGATLLTTTAVFADDLFDDDYYDDDFFDDDDDDDDYYIAPSNTSNKNQQTKYYDSDDEVIIVSGKDIIVKQGNKESTIKNAHYVENGTTMVSLRKVFEVLGNEVKFDNATNKITIMYDSDYDSDDLINKADDKMVLTIGSKTAYADGDRYTLAVAPTVKNGTTYIPLRFVAETLDADVVWQK